MSLEERLAGVIVVCVLLFACMVPLALLGGLGSLLSLPGRVADSLASGPEASASGPGTPGASESLGQMWLRATNTPRPTRTPRPERTRRPTRTPRPTREAPVAGSLSGDLTPTEAAGDTPTPEPTATERATAEPSETPSEPSPIEEESATAELDETPSEPSPIEEEESATAELDETPSEPSPIEEESATETPIPEAEPATVTLTVVTAEGQRLNLRAAPSADAAILSSLPTGAQAVVLGRSADNLWARIRVEESGQEGWVSLSETLVAVNGNVLDLPVLDAP